jgi:hypothetical protein
MAVRPVTAEADQLDRLADALGQHFNIRLSRHALERLDVEIKGAASRWCCLWRAKLRELGIANATLR